MLWRYIMKLYQNNRGLWSRLVDGVFSALLLLLGSITILLVIPPIAVRFGRPGLLVYMIGLLAIAMYALQQALIPLHPDTRRAWFGIAGGMLAWSVAVVNNSLGVPIFPNQAGIVLLIMVSLIVALLWKSVPLGARFFSLAFLLNWVESIFLNLQPWLASFSPIFALLLRLVGVLALAGALMVAGWILLRSRGRIQRVSGALALYFLVSLFISIFGIAG
jgi:hypothetical protein